MKVTSGHRALAFNALREAGPSLTFAQAGILVDVGTGLVEDGERDAARELFAVAVSAEESKRIVGLLAVGAEER